MARAKKPARTKVSEDIFDLIGKSDNIREASAAMQAMAHPLRLKILCLVGNQELQVNEIVEAVGTTQSNVSQHRRAAASSAPRPRRRRFAPRPSAPRPAFPPSSRTARGSSGNP